MFRLFGREGRTFFLLITASALVVSLAPIFTSEDYLVWIGVIACTLVAVHAAYYKEVREAVGERANAFDELGASSGFKDGSEANAPKAWLDLMRAFFLAALVLTFLQIIDDATAGITSPFYGLFAFGMVFFFLGIVETTRIMRVADNHQFKVGLNLGDLTMDLVALSGAITNVRILLAVIPELPNLDWVISLPYVLVFLAGTFAASATIARLHPFPNRGWGVAMFVFLSPYIVLGLYYMLSLKVG